MTRTILVQSLLLAAMSLLTIPPAAAQLLKNGPSVFNYNYIDILYLDDESANGLGLLFSADIRNNYALQVGYTRVSQGQFTADTVSGGVTYHIEATRFRGRADWLFNLGIDIVDINGTDETGLDAGAGIRYAVNDPLELNASLNLSTAFDADLSLDLRALYEVATGFSAVVAAEIGDGTALGIGLRYYWR